MKTQTIGPYDFSPCSVGIDWLTATAPHGVQWKGFRSVGNALLEQARAAGGDVKPAALRDYGGFRADGLFVGRRHADNIIRLSGALAACHALSVARQSRNVSRLDLQVTLFTHGEQPRLALHTYRALRRRARARHRQRTLTYVESHPRGETLYLGRRTSDFFGRLYDKASESKMGEPRTLWRYEVEVKRRKALALASRLLRVPNAATEIECYVRQWWAERGARPAWTSQEHAIISQLLIGEKQRDVLAWLTTSVSVTVRRAIDTYGLDVVVSALGLTDSFRKFGGQQHGDHSRTAVGAHKHQR
jgi:Replication initiation factor